MPRNLRQYLRRGGGARLGKIFGKNRGESCESKCESARESFESAAKSAPRSENSARESQPESAESAQDSTQDSPSISPQKPHTPLFYQIHILHNDLDAAAQELLAATIAPFSDFAALDFIAMDGRFAEVFARFALTNHFSKEVLYKLLLSTHFPRYEKIIVSDVDVVFLGDVSASFLAFEGEGAYIAGVRANDPEAIFPLKGWKEGYKKFSAAEFEAIQHGVGGGYLIANLKKWRRDNLEARLLNCLENNAPRLVLAEQDVLNLVCYPNIATLSPAHIVWHAAWKVYGESWERLCPKFYSQNALENARERPIQLHFIGEKKPWNTPSEPKSDIWYRYLAKTPALSHFLANLEGTLIQKYLRTTLPYRAQRYLRRHPWFMFEAGFWGKVLAEARRGGRILLGLGAR